MGKGHWRRPPQISEKELEDNWTKTFGTCEPDLYRPMQPAAGPGGVLYQDAMTKKILDEARAASAGKLKVCRKCAAEVLEGMERY